MAKQYSALTFHELKKQKQQNKKTLANIRGHNTISLYTGIYLSSQCVMGVLNLLGRTVWTY